MKKIFLLVLLVASTLQLHAQNTQYFTGFIRSAENAKFLSNTRVVAPYDSVETFTNEAGYFSLVVSSDTVLLFIERPGYEIVKEGFGRNDGDPVTIEISPIENYEFTDFRPTSITDGLVYNPQPDQIILSDVEASALPFIFCEPDIIKALQVHPGVDFASDGFADMVVRGGGLGQNLISLDGAPVYGLGHLGGFISNFNSDMVENVTLYKAAFPARHGGRLSSIAEVTSNSGNGYDATVRLATSPILANLNVGLPLDDKGSSLAFGVRRSYVDLLLDQDIIDLVLRDFNTKLKLVLNDKNSVVFNFYSLKDLNAISFQDEDSAGNPSLINDFSFVVRNRTSSVKVNHIHNKRLTAKYSAYYTNFGTSILLEEQDFQPTQGGFPFSDLDVKFSAGEIGLNADYEYRKDKKSLIRFGLQNTLHQYNSGSLSQTSYDITRTIVDQDNFGDTVLQNGFETALYIEDEYKVSDRLKVNVGLRNVLYSYQDFTKFFLEPRFYGRYLLNDKSSVKFSYARMNQFTHLYNTDGGAASDLLIWRPASNELKPQGSNILSLGYAVRSNQQFQFLSEVYFKTLSNQHIFYSADIFDRADIEANSLTGTGNVFGWENSIRYTNEIMMFYMSATFSRSTRNFELLNRGESFFFDYDRRLVGKAGFIYTMGSFILSANAVVATGNPYTLPTSKYRDIDGGIVLAYDEINNYRAIAHNRLDLKVEYFFPDEAQSIEFMVYNMFGTRNVSSIFSERDDTSFNNKYIAYTRSSFQFLPFITYRIRI